MDTTKYITLAAKDTFQNFSQNCKLRTDTYSSVNSRTCEFCNENDFVFTANIEIKMQRNDSK